MTKKAEKDTKQDKRAKPKLKKETVKDLEVGERAEAVKGGIWVSRTNNGC